MSRFGPENCSLRTRMGQLSERLSNPAVRDRVVNAVLAAGLALVAGLSLYMLLFGR